MDTLYIDVYVKFFFFTKTLSFSANWREEFPKYGRPRVNKKSFSGF